MKKLLLSFILAFYLVIGYEINFNAKRNHQEVETEKMELDMHTIKEEDLEKIIGVFDYLNGGM